MKDIPVRMISYGGSNYNISFLIKAEDKKRALIALSEGLLINQLQTGFKIFKVIRLIRNTLTL